MLALGIVREPTVWWLMKSKHACKHLALAGLLTCGVVCRGGAWLHDVDGLVEERGVVGGVQGLVIPLRVVLNPVLGLCGGARKSARVVTTPIISLQTESCLFMLQMPRSR